MEISNNQRPKTHVVKVSGTDVVDGVHVNPVSILVEKIAIPERGEFPYALFLGAGASISSGVKSSSAMVNEWKRKVYDEEKTKKSSTDNLGMSCGDEHAAPGNDKSGTNNTSSDDDGFKRWKEKEFDLWRSKKEAQSKIDRNDSDYGALFSYFVAKPAERQLYIEKLIKDVRPAFGYLYLAGLISDKRFNRILTTNFDELLSDALIHYYEARPVVYSFDSAVAGARMAGKRAKIIKLHGDYLYDNIKNIRNEVHALEENMERKLYESCKDAGLVVIGYSGNDESIMAPLRDMLRKPGYLTLGLHWCLYRNPVTSELEIGEELKRLASSYRGDIYFYEISTFDELMEKIFRSCECPLPYTFTRPHEKNLPKRFYDSVIQGSNNRLTTGMHQDLHNIMASVREPIDDDEYKVLDAEMSWKWGVINRDNERFDEARINFDEGFRFLENLINKKTGKLTGEFTKNGTPNTIMQALRRFAGLLIAKAKLNLLQWESNENESDKEDAIQAIELVVKIVNGAEDLILKIDKREIGKHDSKTRGLTPPLRRSIYYQGICAYGIKKSYYNKLNAKGKSLNDEGKSLSDEEKKRMKDWLDKLRHYDTDGQHLANLLKDPDCYSLIGHEIDGDEIDSDSDE